MHKPFQLTIKYNAGDVVKRSCYNKRESGLYTVLSAEIDRDSSGKPWCVRYQLVKAPCPSCGHEPDGPTFTIHQDELEFAK